MEFCNLKELLNTPTVVGAFVTFKSNHVGFNNAFNNPVGEEITAKYLMAYRDLHLNESIVKFLFTETIHDIIKENNFTDFGMKIIKITIVQ